MNYGNEQNAKQALGEIHKQLLGMRQAAIDSGEARVMGLEYFQGTLDVAIAAIKFATMAPAATDIPANQTRGTGGKV